VRFPIRLILALVVLCAVAVPAFATQADGTPPAGAQANPAQPKGTTKPVYTVATVGCTAAAPTFPPTILDAAPGLVPVTPYHTQALSLHAKWTSCTGRHVTGNTAFATGGTFDASFSHQKIGGCPTLLDVTFPGTGTFSWADGTNTTAALDLRINSTAGHVSYATLTGHVTGPIGGLYEFTSPINGDITLARGLNNTTAGGDCSASSPITAMLAKSVMVTIGKATPSIVSVGDSSVSGEGGRWAGNTDNTFSTPVTYNINGKNVTYTNNTDTGSDAYSANDNATGIAENCHRSKSAEVYIGKTTTGVPVSAANFGCSGALTGSGSNDDGVWKPGLTTNINGYGPGQLSMLETWAESHSVHAVVVRIGVNNFSFADVVAQCVKDFTIWSTYCSQPSWKAALQNFTPSAISANTTSITAALGRVADAMTAAGYPAAKPPYKIIVETYPSPILEGLAKQQIGGCGIYDVDAEWMNNTALVDVNNAITHAVDDSGLTNIVELDFSESLVGHRLCEADVNLFEDAGLGNSSHLAAVQDPSASDTLEWVTQAQAFPPSPYTQQEGFHPNYWGQLAQRNCLRQTYSFTANVAVATPSRLGLGVYASCITDGFGLDTENPPEPNMTLDGCDLTLCS
jgi:hypothetical protein